MLIEYRQNSDFEVYSKEILILRCKTLLLKSFVTFLKRWTLWKMPLHWLNISSNPKISQSYLKNWTHPFLFNLEPILTHECVQNLYFHHLIPIHSAKWRIKERRRCSHWANGDSTKRPRPNVRCYGQSFGLIVQTCWRKSLWDNLRFQAKGFWLRKDQASWPLEHEFQT